MTRALPVGADGWPEDVAYLADLPKEAMSQASFVDLVWEQGRIHHRNLPWRYLDDPYQVLVSEVMLQQTQVKRVLNYWPRWMKMFPTVDALAAASQSDVLAAWQGLGYNRRGLALKRLADECAATLGGRLPDTAEGLQALPGVGPATAAGVMAFAYNVPGVYLETNVRSVFLHCLFPEAEGVSDKRLIPLVRACCPGVDGPEAPSVGSSADSGLVSDAPACSLSRDPRHWYYALLDFGAHLKSQGVNPSRRSAHYSRQSTFEGSRRQKRANILRIVLDDPGISWDAALRELNKCERKEQRPEVDAELFESIVADLVAEGFFPRNGNFLG